ncbi:HET-domain-containing protein [Xylariaceae sp. FL0804]|nr:HET-domain-containing protein [Xylariaceae sp. FL0804]
MEHETSLPVDELHHERGMLENRVECLPLPCIGKFGGSGEFLPADQFEALLTQPNVARALMEYQVEPTDDLVHFILKKANAVFLTLLYVHDVGAVIGFMEANFHDEHLPVVSKIETDNNGRRSLVIASLNEATNTAYPKWPCLTRWSHRGSFAYAQWRFLAPKFGGSNKFYRKFHPNRPLPFVGISEGSGKRGHFSAVHKVEVHRAHMHPETSPDTYVAVKVFNTAVTDDNFHKEVGILDIIRHLDHPHLVKPIAAYENENYQCVLFPWAGGGNLGDYWKRGPATSSSRVVLDEGFTSWTLCQIRGLCNCLKLLWDQNCHHRDLKPENILYTGRERGNFIIADVGLSKFHTDKTVDRPRSSSAKYRTRRYAAPELESDQLQALSRDYDMWAMGVVLLEWLIWLANGTEGLRGVSNLSQFWQGTDHGVEVANAALNWMDETAQTFSIGTALGDLLGLIRTRLLVVELVRDDEPPEAGRAKAAELSRRVDEIVEQAEQDRSYLFDAETWRKTRTGRSRIGASLGLLETPGLRRGLVKMPVTPAAEEMKIQPTDPANVPSVVVDFALEIPGQDGPGPLPDEYHMVTETSHNVWKTIPDSDFGQLAIREMGLGALPKARSTLCDNCRSMNFTEPNFNIRYDMEALRAISTDCGLCGLFYHSLLEGHVGPAQRGVLTRDGYTFRTRPKGKAIISVYRDPTNSSTASIYAQLGFPQLPQSGSSQQVALLLQWLRSCNRNHNCRPTTTSPRKLPTRLIYVGEGPEPGLRLVETHGISNDIEYVTLSHRWGTVPKEGLASSTYRSNIDSHKQAINFDRLPKSFQDAVTVTRALGLHYLWIDSLCIIQKDEEDWEAEVGKMMSVFHSAYCTIAASSAASCEAGFLHDRKPRGCVTVGHGEGTLYLCKAIDDFHGDVEEALLNKRGWVFQERALSRRILHFTSNQVYWECGMGIRCETLARLEKYARQ